MMLAVPDVLDRAAVEAVRAALDEAEWIDGNATAGPQAKLAKRNMQVPQESPVAQRIGGQILDALGRTPLFIVAALPLKVFPPMFNRYSGGEKFDTHIDNAVRIGRGNDFRLRSDLSATLFLSDLEDYDGGELCVETPLGVQQTRLPAGHMLLYPASSLHHVTPVTRGTRLASFFWIQSMVRDDGARRLLFDLDRAIQTIARDRGQDDPAIIQLTGVYHNLVRRWADV